MYSVVSIGVFPNGKRLRRRQQTIEDLHTVSTGFELHQDSFPVLSRALAFLVSALGACCDLICWYQVVGNKALD